MILRCLMLAAALSAGNAEFERESRNTAVEISLARVKAKMFAEGLGTNVLETAMLASPQRFKSRVEAEKICRALYAEEIDRVYRLRAAEIVRELGGDATTYALSDAERAKMMSGHFDKAFSSERASACRTQAETIALKVKPDEADLESKGDDEARVWLTERIASARGLAVFEENLGYISEKIVDPILADARKERKRQQEYLMRTRCEAYAPDRLARELEANLRKNVAENKAKCADPERAWGIFPRTMKENLPKVVERRLVGLVTKEIEKYQIGVDAAEIESTFRADPAAHRKRSDSERVFDARYSKQVTEGAFAVCESAVPLPERASFSEYVRARMQSEEIKHAVEARVKREVLPKWRAFRDMISKNESDRLWPALADGTWYPAADLADRVLAEADRASVVKTWRKDAAFGPISGAGEAMLEESDATADRRVHDAFDLAQRALKMQLKIVDDVHSPILIAARDLSKGLFTRKPDLASVVEMLTQATTKEWTECRERVLWDGKNLPKNAEEQHTELFPSVKRKIELVAREILEEVERQEKEAKSESETEKSNESSEEDVCTISFRVEGGEVVVEAKRGSSIVATSRAKATAKGFEDAVREVGAVVGRKVLRLK